MAEVYLLFKVKYRIIDGKNPKLDLKIANAIGSLCTLFYYSSPLAVRQIGSWLYEKYDYPVQNDVFMIFYAIMTIIYFVFSMGCSPFKDFRELKKIEAELIELENNKG